MASNITTYSQYTKRFNKALITLLDGDETTVDEFDGKRSREDLQYLRDYYQRYRDLNVILLSLLYVLNVVDAYVDAHLFYWSVNDDLAFQAQPVLTPQPMLPNGGALAMQLLVRF